MLLTESIYEYAPAFMLFLMLTVFSILAVIQLKKRDRLKKRVCSYAKDETPKIERILHYYSYECFLVEYYMKSQATANTAALHRDFARALRRALVYAGVPKDVISEYGNRKDERL